ncbi:serine hydroxymethyltransferase [Mesomycoplasma lagogenitalium]|uniref:Serine hydroxymethyltransferase n=1 Tax=Mesomycoplasma lagogenitalium TaxID=171286 RepID=A0ABY8LUW8_9BACT|nr:serine hydroxymethyltransferase [Mesomycoplasma lagogenitalium]WGI37026.1 serine hydroxymethyltransferase [Mesomycoplasma lagogenitalium]
MYKKIKLKDKKIENAINNELTRQKNHIELIASENYASEEVMKVTGSILTNKYGEGYPGKRYYDGCENVDKVENLAIERLKKIFNVKYANVQPYSGSTANAAAIAALVEPNGKIMGMSLSSGGHLTHGYGINFSGKFYQSFSYDVDERGLLNYDNILKLAKEIKPNLIICGYSAYSRTIDFKKFRQIADEVGAYLMADIAHIAGLIAAGVHPSPVEYAHIITSTTHKTLRGARGGIIMTNIDEIANKVNRWVFPGYQGGPLFHSIAGKAVAFNETLQPFFKEYGKQIVINSKAFAKEFQNFGAEIVSGGTDNHLFTINVKKSYNVTGKDASSILQQINITVNKNTIPNDQESPFVTSGVRLGTAAMTSRGFKEKEFKKLALIIDQALKNKDNKSILKGLKKQVLELTKNFPIKKSYWD